MKKLLPLIILGALAVLPLVGLNTYLMHVIILAVMWTVAGIAGAVVAVAAIDDQVVAVAGNAANVSSAGDCFRSGADS